MIIVAFFIVAGCFWGLIAWNRRRETAEREARDFDLWREEINQ